MRTANCNNWRPMYLSQVAACSKASWPEVARCWLPGARISTAVSPRSVTASLTARKRMALRLYRHWERGQRRRKAKGYRQCRWQGRHTTQHRVIMSVLLGRPLARNEHVHHIDGRKHNNAPWNLQVLSATAHQHLTRGRYVPVGYCLHCGKPFVRRCPSPRRGLFCCRACGFAARRGRPGHYRVPTPSWAQPFR